MSISVVHGDCLVEIPNLHADGELFDAVVCDPPYHLTSIVKRFGGSSSAPAKFGKDGAFARSSKGFMNRVWDGGDIAFRPETWALVYAAMKPGAHLVAFGGSRGYHRMACAIEDAGFEIRDSLMWLYGTGFPKSHDVSKAIDKAAGVTFSSKPASGVGFMGAGGPGGYNVTINQLTREGQTTPEAAQWQGWGTALKPAFEPIVLARKPLGEKTVAANVLVHGVGGINIDACRIELSANDPLRDGITGRDGAGMDDTKAWGFKAVDRAAGLGRFPANVLHDGSDEVMEAFAAYGEKTSGNLSPHHSLKASENGSMSGANYARNPRQEFGGDTGTAARFFYQAKANASDRAGSKHPTVKPLALMRWLCRLVTPPGGRILDPFAGSGTTLQAAHECGFSAVGIEREDEYVADILRRIDVATKASVAPVAKADRQLDLISYIEAHAP